MLKITKQRNGFTVMLGKFKLFSHHQKEIDPLLSCCYIPELEKLLQKGTIFPHPYGIVISELVQLGNNNIIYQNVTLGTDRFAHGGKEKFYPTIGSNVTIYSGAVVAGGVTIGDGAIIGANAVVLQDVPAGGLAVGAPAVIKKRGDEDATR